MELKDITLVQCIESKPKHSFEENLETLIYSSKKYNGFVTNVAHKILQPSDYNIGVRSLSLIKDNNISFDKYIIESKQINQDINYTNICETSVYFKDKVHTKYMIWMDLDVMFLKDHNILFKDTDKTVVNSTLISSMIKDEEDLIERFSPTNFNNIYKDIFRDKLSEEHNIKIPNINYYVNTWFILDHADSKFWSKWRNLTYILIEIIQEYHPELVDKHYESICEELSASILYELNSEDFIDTNVYFDTPDIEYIIDNVTENTFMLHYEEYSYMLEQFNLFSEFQSLFKDLNIFSKLLINRTISSSQFKKVNNKR